MTVIASAPGSGRYLVSSTRGDQLSAFLSELSADPELHLLDTLGPLNAPHTAVVEMPHAKASQLQQRFAAAGELHIEPDQQLKMFPNPAGRP